MDSTTADAIASSIGLGSVRHMEVKYLWAQEAHQKNRNPADVLTKPKSVSGIEDEVNALGGHLAPRNVWRIMSVTRRQRWADIDDSGDLAHNQTVSLLLARAMWKCPIPQVMTANSGERTIVAARGRRYRKTPDLIVVVLCSCFVQ